MLKISGEKKENYSLIFGTIESILNSKLSAYPEETITYDELIYSLKVLTKDDLVELLTIFGASTELSSSTEKSPRKYLVSNDIEKRLRQEVRMIPIKDDLMLNLKTFPRNDNVEFYESGLNRSSFSIDSHDSLFSIDLGFSDRNYISVRKDISSFDEPFYPSIADLILEKFEIDLIQHNFLIGKLLLKIPLDFKGKIEEIKYSDGNVFYKLRLYKIRKAALKFFIEKRENNLGKSITIPIETEEQHNTFTFPFKPNLIDVILIDDTNNIIHKISRIKGDFYDEFSRGSEAIQKKILTGEGLTCDFKESLPSNENLVKLLCAFANTKGGDILLGVDDDANVIGIIYPQDKLTDFDAIETHIQNLIDENIDPPIKVEGFTVTLKNKSGNDCEIGVIRVKESKSLVMNKIDKRYYIRRGSTNRVAKSDELKGIIS
ncbi:MAG: AlbA family DNA-binding domain-containing protein [Promethearchaeota archaeon]